VAVSLPDLRMRNVSGRIVEKVKTYFTFNNILPRIVPFKRQCGKIL